MAMIKHYFSTSNTGPKLALLRGTLDAFKGIHIEEASISKNNFKD